MNGKIKRILQLFWVFFKIGAFLLLDEQEEAKKLLDTLEEKDLNYFKEFPIYKFYKKTEEVCDNG